MFVFAAQLAELTQLSILVLLDAYKIIIIIIKELGWSSIQLKILVLFLRNVKYADFQKLGSFQVAQQKYN